MYISYKTIHILAAVVLFHATAAFTTTRSSPFVVKQGLVPTIVLFSSNADEDANLENTTPTEVPASLPPQPPQPVARLDPLVASLTRMDDDTKRAKTIKTPLLEVPVDGSLVVLIPAVLIGVVGFVMSVIVGINSQDAILKEWNKLGTSEQQVQQQVDDGSCRGLCGSQDEFVGKKFMESLKK